MMSPYLVPQAYMHITIGTIFTLGEWPMTVEEIDAFGRRVLARSLDGHVILTIPIDMLKDYIYNFNGM